MEKIKVAIVLPYFGTGGAEKMVSQLAAGMDKEVFHTEVFCIYGFPIGNHMEQMLHDKEVPIHYIGKQLGFSLSAIGRLFKALDNFNPDVIHTHLYACMYTFPWVMLHGKSFLHTFHLPPELENRRLLRRVASKVLVKMKKMIPLAISHQNQKFLSQYYGLAENEIPVVYNPVDLSKFNDPKPRTNAAFTYITAGRFSVQKNQKMMLRAFAAFLKKGYDARLILLGKGEEEDNLRALACELGINNRIDFAGFVVNVEDYLVNADVFLLSSDYEALPLALLEAMAAGLPIIATDVGGVRDILTDNGVLITAGNMDAMVEAMEYLYLSDAVRKKMSECAVSNVQAFDISNTVSGYSELYRSLANK